MGLQYLFLFLPVALLVTFTPHISSAVDYFAEADRLQGIYGNVHSACANLIQKDDVIQSARCDHLIQSYNLHMKRFIDENLENVNVIISPLSYEPYNVTQKTVDLGSAERSVMAEHFKEELSLLGKVSAITQSCIDRMPLDENIVRLCGDVEMNLSKHFTQLLSERNDDINQILYG